ncbi:unnamed protein product [Effrenium voratum]|nr:unnamed protein product [Effrenium voratum]
MQDGWEDSVPLVRTRAANASAASAASAGCAGKDLNLLTASYPWRVDSEDLWAWRKRAVGLMKQMRKGPEKEQLDIGTDMVRLISAQEEVEEIIKFRLSRSGIRPSELPKKRRTASSAPIRGAAVNNLTGQPEQNEYIDELLAESALPSGHEVPEQPARKRRLWTYEQFEQIEPGAAEAERELDEERQDEEEEDHFEEEEEDHFEEEEEDEQEKEDEERIRSENEEGARSEANAQLAIEEEEANLPTYKELLLDRWRQCSGTASGSLLLNVSQTIVWKRVGHQRVNTVLGSPHKRWLNKIMSRYFENYPSSQRSERECVTPCLKGIPEDVERVGQEEVVLTVVLCEPKNGCKDQEYDVLASQTLHELKDAFYFLTDWMHDGPTRLDSGCMYIDGAFYSDMRHESSVDYAENLIDWIRSLGHMKLREEPSRSMATRLCDLQIPFGEQCCYISQGDVEHHMYFTGARLVNFGCECPLREAYPCLIYMRKFQKQYCMVCTQNLALWSVHGSSKCPFDPCMFCHLCFQHFFQDKDGELIPPVDFKVFPHLHEP